MMEWAGRMGLLCFMVHGCSDLGLLWVVGCEKMDADGCSSSRGRQRLVVMGTLAGGSGETWRIACTRVETR